MSRIIVLNGSPRKNGVDSNIASMISEEFLKEGHDVEVVNICDLDIGGCKGCMSCRKTGVCVQDDDMNQMIERIRKKDMLILMAPIYFAAENGQTKTFIDRFTSAFTEKRPLGDVRVSSVLLTCSDPNGSTVFAASLKRIYDVMGYLKIENHDDGHILGGLSPDNVRDSPAVREYLEGLKSLLRD